MTDLNEEAFGSEKQDSVSDDEKYMYEDESYTEE